MKRSPSSSAASSSSSSSCVDQSLLLHNQSVKPKTKRVKRNQNPVKRQNVNSSSNSSGGRSSIYRGVTRHRWTGRFEAHLWDKSSWNNIQNKKGRQVYLGAYDGEEAAAHTYDLAALKYWGPDTTLNFSIDTYKKELEEMQSMSKEEYLASLRRRSSGFSRGVSKYRGVARHHHNGRWEARIGRVFGNKYLYLGTYTTQEEAAAAYDMAAIEYRGENAVTNFDISNYIGRVKKAIPQVELQQPNLNCSSTEKEEGEEEQEQEQQEQQMVPPQVLQNPQLLLPSIDSSAMVVLMDDPADDHHHMNPWSFYFDTGFNPLPVPDIPLDKLPDLFDETTGFEDNIDFIFDGVSMEEEEFNPDSFLDSTSTTCGGVDEVDISKSLEEDTGQQERVSSFSSSSSSPSSTTTSVSLRSD